MRASRLPKSSSDYSVRVYLLQSTLPLAEVIAGSRANCGLQQTVLYRKSGAALLVVCGAACSRRANL